MLTDLAEKVAQNYFCECCHYSTSKKTNFDKHILTRKHKNTYKYLHLVAESSQKVAENKYECVCGNSYKYRQSLYSHKKTCKKIQNENNQIISSHDNNSSLNEKDLIITLLQQNNNLQNQLIEMAKNAGHNTTNSHNKTFNLQVFLNETCKDAMNIMDFVNSMEIDLDDLEKVGELGYVNGMTNIILKNLNALDITKRPLHCTDAKREIMYIKDDNKWEKETENKDKMKKALKYIMHKNAKMLNVFRTQYPDCIKSYSKRSDQYNKLVIEVLGGKGDNEPQHNEKIIRKIAKEMVIDKTMLAC